MLVARGLGKRYGQVAALAGFDLRVRPGEIVGLVGHNGAGKTTFASAVAGLVRPDRGQVTIDGIDVGREPHRARQLIGLAPQELALYPTVTVRDNLRLFGGLAGLRGRGLRRAIDQVAAELDLAGVLDRRVGLLSGGQQRRTQAATAMLAWRPLLLLDEPTVGTDPQARTALLAAVRARAAEGAAVCYTTHYLPELEELAATLAVAARGKVIARGRRDELLAGLPGEVRLRFAGQVPEALRDRGRLGDDGELHVSARDPADVLVRLLRELPRDAAAHLVAADVRQPSLDDLYRALAAGPDHPAYGHVA